MGQLETGHFSTGLDAVAFDVGWDQSVEVGSKMSTLKWISNSTDKMQHAS